MSNSVLILGESGSGKSTSMRNLNHKETFIINVISKPLPFKGWLSKYKKLSSDGMEGNYYATDDNNVIKKIINLVNSKRPDIKTIILDDFGYTISNSFMRKAHQKGYDRFVDIAKDMFDILDMISNLRDDLFCFVMMHTDTDNQGRSKPRTIGKMIDQYICIEGKFSTVMHACICDGEYKFLTNGDSSLMCKSPLGMFNQSLIDNDLEQIIKQIKIYNEGE